MINWEFLSMTYHFIFLASCMHASYENQVKCLMPKSFPKVRKIWEIQWKLGLVPQNKSKRSLDTRFKRSRKSQPGWQSQQNPALKRRSGILRSLHSLRLDQALVFANVQVLNKASRLQVTRLIAPTCGLHRAGQRATLKDQELIQIGSDRTQPLHMPSYSPNW